MVTGIGRSLRMRRSRSAEIMVFSKGDAGGEPGPGWVSVIDQVALLLPVRLHQHAVDVVDVDGLGGTADGLDHAADAEVAGLTQNAVGRTHDQLDGGRREGVVAQADAVQFAQDEVAHVLAMEAFGDDRVGDAALDVQVDAQVQRGQQVGPADEDEVVVFGEILEEEPQLAQVGQVHEVSVVEDGGQRLAGAIEAEGLLNEPAFAGKSRAFELDAESLAEDLDGVGVGVQGASDGGDQVLVYGVSSRASDSPAPFLPR